MKIALAAVAAAVAALALGVTQSFAADPFRVSTSVSDRFLYFGDSVTARVTVYVDSRQIRAGSIRVSPRFRDWDQVSPTKTTSTRAGRIQIRSWSFELACLQTSCLPNGKPLRVQLPRVIVSATAADGSTRTLSRDWPALEVTQRFGLSTSGATPTFELDQALPAATFRVDPTALAYGLDAGAALFAGLGLLLAIRAVVRRRPARAAETPQLARALTLVRQARVRPTEDRRRAVGLLARVLERNHAPSLSAKASTVAWSSSDPSRERLDDLVQMVEEAHEHSP